MIGTLSLSHANSGSAQQSNSRTHAEANSTAAEKRNNHVCRTTYARGTSQDIANHHFICTKSRNLRSAQRNHHLARPIFQIR